jgi:hypothetical protein
MAVAVWDALETQPGYAAMAALLQRLLGRRIASELHAPLAIGRPRSVACLFSEGGHRGH